MQRKATGPATRPAGESGRAGGPPEGRKQAVAEVQRANPASAAADPITELFLALEGPLLSYAHRLAPRDGVAEDLVQEAFLRLHGQFAAVREPKRWLYRTVHNLALNHHRRAAKTVPFPGTIPGSDGGGPAREPADETRPGPDEALARQEQLEQLRASVAQLDERSRTLLRLKFHEDLSYRQISERTGLTVGHVGYLLHHAIKGLGATLASPQSTS